MHVLMVAERLEPAIGGVERHVAGVARELAGSGHRVTLVAPAHDPGLPAREVIDGREILRLPVAGRGRWKYPRAWGWWAARRSLLAEVDLIHFHDVYALIHWFGPVRLLCPGKPVYLTYHGYEMRWPVPHRARLYRRLAERVVRGAICVGHYLATWFGLQPQAVTYGAVTLPEELDPPPPRPQAVFVGRLAPDTGVDVYLQGLGLLAREYGLHLPLVVCGEGPWRGAMEDTAAAGGLDVTFEGAVPDPGPYLARASLVFAPGYLAMLEAMAHRRPVVSVYNSPVRADYLRSMPEPERILSIAGEAGELAAVLARMLSAPADLAAQVEAAYRFASRWTWASLAQTYVDLWGMG